MSKKDVFIFEVSQQSFESSIIQNSSNLPVLVEFMGVWSEPCIQLSDEISYLAEEFAGQFIFAKIDIDEQPELKEQFSIENVPTLKIFVNGEVVQTEEGLLNKVELRELLKVYGIYSELEEIRQQARKKHMAGDTLSAIQLLTSAMQQDPSNIKVAMDMVQIFIDLTELEQAENLFNQLPDEAKKTDMGKMLIGQLTFLSLASKTKGKSQLQQSLIENPNDCDSHFDLAVCLIAEKDYETAINQLFEVMKIDKEYKEGAAREMIVTVTNMLAKNNPEQSSKFRGMLSSFLNI